MVISSIGILIIRLGCGGLMLWFHGLPKLLQFSEKAAAFPDPLGLGSSWSLALAVFAEFFCSILIIWGILTRLSAVPLVITMVMAAFVIHGDDPWNKKEFALLYAIPFLALVFTGPGKISIDHFMFKKSSESSLTLPS